MRLLRLFPIPALLLGLAGSASANLETAQHTAKVAIAAGRDAVGRGELDGAVAGRKIAGVIPVARMADGSQVEHLAAEVIVGEAKGRTAASVETQGALDTGLLQRTFDVRTGAHKHTVGATVGGRTLIYNPWSKVLARERADGTWGVQRIVGGRFTKQVIVPTREAADRRLGPLRAAGPAELPHVYAQVNTYLDFKGPARTRTPRTR